MSNELNRGLRWGQLLAGIEGARAQLDLAARAIDLLSKDDQERLRNARDLLAAVEQRAWSRKDAEARDGKGGRRER